MNGYNELVTRCFFAPPTSFDGPFEGAASAANGSVLVYFRTAVEGQKFAGLGFRVFACPHIIAACRQVVERLEGEPVSAAVAINWPELQQTLGMPVEKAGKLLIIQDAIESLCHEIGAGSGK
jgi:hypothetical protein